jgi:hypothetical protein
VAGEAEPSGDGDTAEWLTIAAEQGAKTRRAAREARPGCSSAFFLAGHQLLYLGRTSRSAA